MKKLISIFIVLLFTSTSFCKGFNIFGDTILNGHVSFDSSSSIEDDGLYSKYKMKTYIRKANLYLDNKIISAHIKYYPRLDNIDLKYCFYKIKKNNGILNIGKIFVPHGLESVIKDENKFFMENSLYENSLSKNLYGLFYQHYANKINITVTGFARLFEYDNYKWNIPGASFRCFKIFDDNQYCHLGVNCIFYKILCDMYDDEYELKERLITALPTVYTGVVSSESYPAQPLEVYSVGGEFVKRAGSLLVQSEFKIAFINYRDYGLEHFITSYLDLSILLTKDVFEYDDTLSKVCKPIFENNKFGMISLSFRVNNSSNLHIQPLLLGVKDNDANRHCYSASINFKKSNIKIQANYSVDNYVYREGVNHFYTGIGLRIEASF